MGKIVIRPKRSKKSNIITLPEVIGMPPEPLTDESQNLFYNSLLIGEIIPCLPNLTKGLTVFDLHSEIKAYKTELANYGFQLDPNSGSAIKLAFQADHLPSESFSNDYGESFLNKMANTASEGAGELMQMMGASSATDALKKIGEFGGGGKDNKGAFGAIAGFAKATDERIQKLEKGGGATGQAAKIADALLGGARVDFPMVWKNSTFSTSYSVTIKLYNPMPSSDFATDKFIIGPITAILMLGLPRVNPKMAEAYNFPYFCHINAKGLFNLPHAAISGISVNKGTEGGIAFNQRLNMVEIRLDFVTIHQHMVSSSKVGKIPTLKNYIMSLKEQEGLYPMYTKDGSDKPTATPTDKSNNDPQVPGPQNDPTIPPGARIDPDALIESNALTDKNPKELAKAPFGTQSSLTPSAPTVVDQMPDAVQTAQNDKALASKAKNAMVQKLLSKRSANIGNLKNSLF